MAYENDFRFQNERAVRCSIATKPVLALEYVKSISSLVGASHILAVFEETDYIKVFFDDRQCVDTLMQNCLHVQGRHINVDYVVPPGVKLILSNVDPVITNCDIIRILSNFGTVVSPIIRPPISVDIELCHISYGVRFVYILLNGVLPPEKIDFRYGDQLSSFKVCSVDPDIPATPFIKTDASGENRDEIESSSAVQDHCNLPGPSDLETLVNTEPADHETLVNTEPADHETLVNTEPVDPVLPPVLVRVESIPQITTKEHLESFNHETPDTDLVLNGNDQSQIGVIIQRKRVGRPPKANRKRMAAVSQTARRNGISKRKWYRGYRKEPYKCRILTKSHYHKRPGLSGTSNNTDTNIPDSVKMRELAESDEFSESSTPQVLSKKDLLKFIEEVKRHRAPLELAKKYIGENCDSEKIHRLIDQLHDFKNNQENINLKVRIWRLNKTLIDALNVDTKKTTDK